MIFIYYFSGTGNSLAAAKRAAEGLGAPPPVGITRELLDSPPPELDRPAEQILVVFPSYAYGLPELVREFLRRFPLRTEYLALAVTFGSRQGGSLASAKRILKRRGLRPALYAAIPAVENYLPIFGPPPEERRRKRLQLQSEGTEALIRRMRAGERNSVAGFRPVFSGVSKLFLTAAPLLARAIRVTPACNLCGLCERVCPARAVQVGEEGVRIDRGSCNQCQACLNVCPHRALRMWRHRADRASYLHPDVSPSELLRR